MLEKHWIYRKSSLNELFKRPSLGTTLSYVLDLNNKNYMKSLKIPKGQAKTVNRRTNNTMDKRNRAKRQTMQWPKEIGRNDKQCNGQKK